MTYQTEGEFSQLLQRFRVLSPRSRMIEIGSLGGETLRHWIDNVGSGSRIVSVDLRVPESDDRHASHREGQEVLWPQWAAAAGVELTVLNADSTRPETFARVRGLVPSVDFLFIDGGHDYATVRSDAIRYSSLVRPGGLVALHDVQGIPDVARFWNEVKGAGCGEEICMPGGWGIGLLPGGLRQQLTIITPCSRPGNLSRLLAGVELCRELLDVRWLIVHDGPVPEAAFPAWVTQKSHRAPDSVAGKAQINVALEGIEGGWVWVLDDDNDVHPGFSSILLDMIAEHPAAKAFVFPQVCGAAVRPVGPRLIRECSIDQAQYVVRRDFIGSRRYPLRYTADGAFVEELFSAEPGSFRFSPTPAVYYNALAATA
ncbi:MAG TPA: class I SAM-dependent methyltransferase [Opitutaceae bacterium]